MAAACTNSNSSSEDGTCFSASSTEVTVIYDSTRNVAEDSVFEHGDSPTGTGTPPYDGNNNAPIGMKSRIPESARRILSRYGYEHGTPGTSKSSRTTSKTESITSPASSGSPCNASYIVSRGFDWRLNTRLPLIQWPGPAPQHYNAPKVERQR